MGDDDQKGRGRPSKFNDKRADQACEAAREGASVAGCARAAGVARSTLVDWLEKHDDFRATFRRARWQGELKWIDTDSQQARFLLARSYEYEETRRQDVTSDGDKVGAFEVSFKDSEDGDA